jgi:hypothetical protein
MANVFDGSFIAVAAPSLVLPGLILIIFGLAIAVDYRGLVSSLPPRLFGSGWSARLLGAWLISGGSVLVLSELGPGGWLLVGLILTTWGLIIGFDYRGLAATMPPRMLGSEWSVAKYRRSFAFFGFVGLVVLVTAVSKLAA